MTEYITSIDLGDNKGARLTYLDRIMSMTITDYGRRKSTTFYREGVDEEGLRKNLFQVSGISKLIKDNCKKIEDNLKGGSLGTHRPFRNLWGLAA